MASTLLQNQKFEELCRLCASKTELMLSVHIFEGEGSIRELNKKIDNCLQLQVHQQDQLPKIICEDCLVKLEMFWDFKDRSFRTEQFLIELYKEFKSSSDQNTENQCVVSIDSHGLILQVQNHQILTEDLSTDIDISQLGQRENPDNYAIILHHNDLNTHHLENLELSNHDLAGQDLSNQSLHGAQENLVVLPPSQADHRFGDDNLNLMQQELLNEAQFRLHHELQVSMTGNSNIYENNLKSGLSHGSEEGYSKKRDETRPLDMVDYSSQKHSLPVDSALSDNSLGVEVDSHLNQIISYSSDSQMEQIHQHDESNSNPNMLGDQEISNVSAVIAKESYLLGGEGMEHINSDQNEDLANLSPNYFSCSLCGKTYESRTAMENHCQSHFFKYGNESESLSYEENSKSSDMEQKVLSKEETSMDSVNGFKNEDSNSVDNPPTPPDQSDLSNESPLLLEIESNSQQSNHLKSGLKNGSKVCQECGKSYKTNYKLAEHMRKHTGERPYKCRSCEKAFRSKIGLAQHEAKHTGQYDFSCPTCGKGFQCKSYLMVHQRVHSDLKPYPCTTCGINFKTKQSLLDHTNRHLGVKPFLCSICNRGFITKGLCRAHEKTHTGVDNRKYSCKICQKRFVSKSYLQTHSRIHTGEKPFICEVCGKGFLTRVDLKIHLTMHTGEKSYVCEMCGKAFARRDALKCHRRMHTGERPYRCDVCGRSFTQFTPMANHRKHHTGEKPYTCETCGKTFVSRSTMVSHAKKHSKKTIAAVKNEIDIVENKIDDSCIVQCKEEQP